MSSRFAELKERLRPLRFKLITVNNGYQAQPGKERDNPARTGTGENAIKFFRDLDAVERFVEDMEWKQEIGQQ